MCDPDTLKQRPAVSNKTNNTYNKYHISYSKKFLTVIGCLTFSPLLPQVCVRKILDVLTSYKHAVERVSGFQSCLHFASNVKPVMHKLHEDMRKCVRSKPGMAHHKVSSFNWNKCKKSYKLWEIYQKSVQDLSQHYALLSHASD